MLRKLLSKAALRGVPSSTSFQTRVPPFYASLLHKVCATTDYPHFTDVKTRGPVRGCHLLNSKADWRQGQSPISLRPVSLAGPKFSLRSSGPGFDPEITKEMVFLEVLYFLFYFFFFFHEFGHYYCEERLRSLLSLCLLKEIYGLTSQCHSPSHDARAWQVQPWWCIEGTQLITSLSAFSPR